MKICFLADPNHINTTNWLRHFSQELGHEIHVIALNKVTTKIDSIIYHNLKQKAYIDKLKYFLPLFKIKRILNKIQPDILVGYRIASYGFLAALTGFHPLVLAGQGQTIVYPENSRIKKKMANYTLKKADLINSWGPHMTKRMIALGADKNIIITAPRGVNTSIFNINNDTEKAPLRIISTRSLNKDPHYNIEPIIEAVEICLKIIPDIEYWVVGDGPQKKQYMKIVQRKNMSKSIKFLGHIPHTELAKYLRKSQIYISNVWTDGVSSSLLEAMACGAFPIVIDNVANRNWITNGKNGYLVKADNPTELSNAILSIIENKKLLKESYGINTTIVKNKADWFKNMTLIERKYLRLIHKKEVNSENIYND
jgi:glycosyltransferase involved in cell wall biosynthesis